jgi:hypothetical protein
MMNDDYGLGVIADQGRWRWDLNPRKGCPFTRFRGVRPRPLGDSTAAEPTRTEQTGGAGSVGDFAQIGPIAPGASRNGGVRRSWSAGHRTAPRGRRR